MFTIQLRTHEFSLSVETHLIFSSNCGMVSRGFLGILRKRVCSSSLISLVLACDGKETEKELSARNSTGWLLTLSHRFVQERDL